MDHSNKDLDELVAKGKTQGYLTYDQVNDYLPDEAVNPEKLDSLLVALDELGIELVNEPPDPSGELTAQRLSRGGRVDRGRSCLGIAGQGVAQAERRSDSDVSVADGGHPAADARRGNPLAKKIELTRKRFRRNVLRCVFRDGGDDPHAGRSASRRAAVRSHDQGVAHRAAHQGADQARMPHNLPMLAT